MAVDALTAGANLPAEPTSLAPFTPWPTSEGPAAAPAAAPPLAPVVPLDAATLATIAIDPATIGPVAANSPAGTVVGTVTIEIDGKRVAIADLPPDQQAQIGLSISGGNGAYALNDRGQLIVVDPTRLSYDRLSQIEESAASVIQRFESGMLHPDLFLQQLQMLRAARAAADPGSLTLEITYQGSLVANQEVRLDMVGLQTPVPVPTSQPVPPYTPEDIAAIAQNGSEYFFEILAQQPEGSKGAILYNLFRARSIADLDGFQDHVDTVAVEADIQALLADPEIQALMVEAQDIAALQQTHKKSGDLAQDMSAYLLDEQTIAWMQTLPPDARAKFIADRVHEIAFFDPDLAKATMEELTGELLDYEMSTSTLADYAPAVVETSVASLFQIAIVGNRFGVGLLGAGAGALAALTEADYNQAVTAYAAHLRAGGSPASFRGSAYAEGLSPTVQTALYEFSDSLAASGATGAVGTVLAAVAVYQDFSGGRFPDTPFEILNVTADLMSMVGGLPSVARAFSFLGLDTKSLAALQSVSDIFLTAAETDPTLMQGVLAGVNFLDANAVYAAIVNDPGALALFATDADGNVLTIHEQLQAVGDFADRMAEVADQIEDFGGANEDFLANMSDIGGAVEDDVVLAEFLAADFEALPMAEAFAVGAEVVEAGLDPAVIAGLAAGTAGEGAVITATTAARLGAVFQGLSVLGAAAELFYGAESFAGAEAAFLAGDSLAGWLNIGAGLSFEVSGLAGIGAFIGSVWGVAALSGPLLPFVTLGAGLAAFGFVLGGFFHARHEHAKQIETLDDFLMTGVGNGKDYFIP